MKRALQFVTVLAAAAMLNGCSKCSGNNPGETAPAVENTAPPAAPAEAPAADMGNTNAAPAQGGEAAPAAPAAPTEAK